MSFTTMTTVAIAPPRFNNHTLDPFQRARPAHTPRLARRVERASSRAPTPTRETRSLDLDPKDRPRLPIGPNSHRSPSASGSGSGSDSASGSRSSTPTPASSTLTSTTTPSPVRTAYVDRLRSRETRALRRQGSIFKIPAPVPVPESSSSLAEDNMHVFTIPAANKSTSSLSSSYSWSAKSVDSTPDSVYSQSHGSVMTTSTTSASVSAPSLRETKGGFSTAQQHRRRDVPAPLILKPNNVQSASSSPARSACAQVSLSPTPNEPPRLLRRRSRSFASGLPPNPASTRNTFVPSDSGYPTPLTPSFRFEVPSIPEHRQKRLNKLAKTLGEHVPPSLVFPSFASGDANAMLGVDTQKGWNREREELLFPTTPVPAQHGRASFDSRTSERDRQKERGSANVKADANANSNSIRRASMLYALDLNTPSKKNPRGSSHWQPPDEWLHGPPEMPSIDQNRRSRTSSGKTGLKERDEVEEDVSGAWNTTSFDAVLERLRHLK